MKLIEVYNVLPEINKLTVAEPKTVIYVIIGSIIIFAWLSIIIFLIYGKNTRLYTVFKYTSHPKLTATVIIIPIAFLYIIGGINDIDRYERDYRNYIYFRNSKVESIEGYIQVLFTQPNGGHTKGDIIKIGNKKFEINSACFASKYAYRISINDGGVLTNGIYAKIYYIKSRPKDKVCVGDGNIVKILIKK